MAATLLKGDCMQHMAAYSDGHFQAIVTSPPYNIGKEYERRKTIADYAMWLRTVVIECGRVLADGGSLWLQVGNCVMNGSAIPIDALAYPFLADAGLVIRNRIVWTVDHGLHATKRLSGRHETILWATKGDNYLFDLDAIRVPQKHPGKRYFKGPRKGELSCNPLGKNPGDVWAITQVKNNHPEKTAHPCQFPEALVERCILASTRPGDRVLDPFGGSGTTAVVADRLGRLCTLIEQSPEYLEIAKARLGLRREAA